MVIPLRHSQYPDHPLLIVVLHSWSFPGVLGPSELQLVVIRHFIQSPKILIIQFQTVTLKLYSVSLTNIKIGSQVSYNLMITSQLGITCAPITAMSHYCKETVTTGAKCNQWGQDTYSGKKTIHIWKYFCIRDGSGFTQIVWRNCLCNVGAVTLINCKYSTKCHRLYTVIHKDYTLKCYTFV